MQTESLSDKLDLLKVRCYYSRGIYFKQLILLKGGVNVSSSHILYTLHCRTPAGFRLSSNIILIYQAVPAGMAFCIYFL